MENKAQNFANDKLAINPLSFSWPYHFFDGNFFKLSKFCLFIKYCFGITHSSHNLNSQDSAVFDHGLESMIHCANKALNKVAIHTTCTPTPRNSPDSTISDPLLQSFPPPRLCHATPKSMNTLLILNVTPYPYVASCRQMVQHFQRKAFCNLQYGN